MQGPAVKPCEACELGFKVYAPRPGEGDDVGGEREARRIHRLTERKLNRTGAVPRIMAWVLADDDGIRRRQIERLRDREGVGVRSAVGTYTQSTTGEGLPDQVLVGAGGEDRVGLEKRVPRLAERWISRVEL